MFKRFMHPYFLLLQIKFLNNQSTTISQELGKTASTVMEPGREYLSGNFLTLDKMNEIYFESLFFLLNQKMI